MRNLKRVLSLTLASVMLLGMMVLGTSAADYTDVDETKHNVEAIDVLTAVGIFEGNGDGTLAPDDLITREQMAKIMALLMNLNTYITGTNPFNDVSGWAEPFVSACYANGIIKGYGDGRFGAQDNISAVQAASMLMRALGYFQSPADEVDGWELSTIRQAGRIDLFNDVGSTTAGEYLTRNQVAQIVLNTLKSGTVQPDNSNRVNVTVGDAQVAVGASNYEFIVGSDASLKYASAIGTKSATVNGVNSPIIELGEKLYQGDLQYNPSTHDAYGRPAVSWSYKTNEIGTYVDYPTVYKSWTAKVARNELYSFLGSTNSSNLLNGRDGSLTVYVDGGLVQNPDKSLYLDRDSTKASGNAGKGVLTEVFQDNYNNVTLTFTGTYLMQATADYSTGSGSVRTTVLTSPIGSTVIDNVLKGEDFDGLADLGIKADDYILYTYSKEKRAVQTVQKANVLVGEVTAYSVSQESNGTAKAFGDAGGSVSIDGNKHDYAKFAATSLTNGCGVEYKVGANASIVLDAYDYAIYVDDSSLSVGNYVYINEIARKGGVGGTFEADAFFTDGTRQTITVKELKGRDSGKKLTANLAILAEVTSDGKKAYDTFDKTTDVQVGGWYSYSVNSNKEYTLEKAINTAAFDSTKPYNDSSLTIANDRVSIGGKVSGNSNTIFVVLGKNNKVSVYTGIANVPDVKSANAKTSWYLLSKDQANKPASAVFIDASGDKATVRNGNTDLLYLLKKDTNTVESTDNKTINSWKVVQVKDGAVVLTDNGSGETVIKTTESNSYWTKQAIYSSYGIDSDGYYDLSDGDAMPETKASSINVNTVEVNLAAKNQAIDGTGDTFTWGGVGFQVSRDNAKAYALVMYPNSTKEGQLLRTEFVPNTGVDYEVITGWTGEQIARHFDGYTVTGNLYAIKDDDLIESMIVVVTGVSKTSAPSGGDTPDQPSADYSSDGTVYASDLTGGRGAIERLFSDKDADTLTVSTANVDSNDISNLFVPANKTLIFNGLDTASMNITLDPGSTLVVNGTFNVDATTGTFNADSSTTIHAYDMTVAKTVSLPGTVKVNNKLTLSTSAPTFDKTTKIEAKDMDVAVATTIKGNVDVSNILDVGTLTLTIHEDGTVSAGKVTGDGIGSSTIVVDGTLIIDGENQDADADLATGVRIDVTSSKSLHVYGAVANDVKIVAGGNDNNTANDGKVEITGELKGILVNQNSNSSTATVTVADVNKNATIVLATENTIIVTGEFNTKKIAAVKDASITFDTGASLGKDAQGLFRDSTTGGSVTDVNNAEFTFSNDFNKSDANASNSGTVTDDGGNILVDSDDNVDVEETAPFTAKAGIIYADADVNGLTDWPADKKPGSPNNTLPWLYVQLKDWDKNVIGFEVTKVTYNEKTVYAMEGNKADCIWLIPTDGTKVSGTHAVYLHWELNPVAGSKAEKSGISWIDMDGNTLADKGEFVVSIKALLKGEETVEHAPAGRQEYYTDAADATIDGSKLP